MGPFVLQFQRHLLLLTCSTKRFVFLISFTLLKVQKIQWRIQDFPEVGEPTLQGGRQHTILPNFPKNCMKLKEFGPPGGARPKFYYVDPRLEINEHVR